MFEKKWTQVDIQIDPELDSTGEVAKPAGPPVFSLAGLVYYFTYLILGLLAAGLLIVGVYYIFVNLAFGYLVLLWFGLFR